MADALYDKGREAFASGSIAYLTDTIKVAFVKSTYTPNLATHQFYSDLTPASNVIGGGRASDFTLGTKSDTSGVVNAANVTGPVIASGTTLSYLVIYKDTGSDATSPLLAALDGKRTLTLAANAALNATTLTVDPLPAPVPASTAVTFGTSGATTTLSAASAGARSVTCTALSAATNAGDTAPYNYGSGLPLTGNGGSANINWDTGTNKIFKL